VNQPEQVVCPECKTVNLARPEAAPGAKVSCEKCGREIAVPGQAKTRPSPDAPSTEADLATGLPTIALGKEGEEPTLMGNEAGASGSSTTAQPEEEGQAPPTVALPERVDERVAEPKPPPEQVAGKFGRYEVIEEIARGGMGIVTKVRDPKLNRVVALKVMIAGEAASEELVQRFHIEAQSAAKLRHANIVAIHDVGVAEGLRYFTMDFVEGESLAKAIRDGSLTTRQSLEILEKTARAVHYAHGQAIVHRDLKPGNVLLDEHGEPQITDFGLAKDIETDFSLTESGAAMGTPAYMPPEQALGESKKVDARSDVYSLGAMMYEMITGRPPFTAENRLALMLRLVDEEAVPPSKLNASVNPDVETICLKCLAKERERRYQTAEELADDIARFLNGEAILARPSSIIYRTRKRLLRHKAVTAVATIALILVVGLVSGWIVTLQEQTRRAQQAAEDATRAKGDAEKAADGERKARKDAEKAAEGEKKAREDAEKAAEEERKAKEEASEARDRAVEEEKKARAALAESHATQAIAYTQRGEYRAAAETCVAGRAWADTLLLRMIQWHAERGRGSPARSFQAHSQAITSVAVSPDGRLLASGGWDGTIKLWDVATGEETETMVLRQGELRRTVFSVAFAPDGKLLASSGRGGIIKVWEVATGKEVRTINGHPPKIVGAVRFSPDGKLLASGAWDKTIKLWDVATGEEIITLRGHAGFVKSIAFSPDGDLLASGSSDKTVKLWDVATGEEIMTLKGHEHQISSVAFSPDGKLLASSSNDRTIKLWNVATAEELMTLKGRSVGSLCFAGRVLVCGSAAGVVSLWRLDMGTTTLLVKSEEPASNLSCVAFSPDGKLLVAGEGHKTYGTVRAWEAATGEETMTLKGHKKPVQLVAFSPDGKSLLSASSDNVVKVWNAVTGEEVRTVKTIYVWGKVNNVEAISPDGKLVALSLREAVKLWDLASGEEIITLKDHKPYVSCARFSPDGKLLASGSLDNTIKLWDVSKGQEILTLGEKVTLTTGRDAGILAVVFSPNGKLLASGSRDNTVKLYDVRTGETRATLKGHSDWVYSVAFSSDGGLLASASKDRTIRLWNAETGEHLMTLFGPFALVRSVTFSPTRHVLASAGVGKTVMLWDVDPAHNPELRVGQDRE